MKVSHFMVKREEIITATGGESIASIADKLIKMNISSLLIVGDCSSDEQQQQQQPIVGLVTKTDTLKAYYHGIDPSKTPVEQIMSKELIYIDENDTTAQVADRMVAEKKHHLLVKKSGSSNQLVGLVSGQDVVREASLDAKAWPYKRTGQKRL